MYFGSPAVQYSINNEWSTPDSLQTNPQSTLFFWYFHSLSSLCGCAHAWLVIFYLCCNICLEESPSPIPD